MTEKENLIKMKENILGYCEENMVEITSDDFGKVILRSLITNEIIVFDYTMSI
jgi:NifB/MoaA-like Fe-S oxidoreductase